MSALVCSAILCVLLFGDQDSENVRPSEAALVDRLKASDFIWRVDEAGEVNLRFRGAALEVLQLPSPPLQELQDAMNRDAGFPCAHFVMSEIVFGPGCALLDEAGWVRFQLVRLKLTRTPGDAPEWTAVADESRDYVSMSDLPKAAVADLRKHINQRIAAGAARKPRAITLAGRRRDVVATIRNADVYWGHAGYGFLSPVLAGDTRIAAESKPSIEALIDALDDPDRYIAAHVLLSGELSVPRECSYTNSRGFHALYDGLRVESRASTHVEGTKTVWKWSNTIPDGAKQRAYLIRRWAARTISAPSERDK